MELLSGHDRFLGDVRPLVFTELGWSSALACHPYDSCTALVLEEAGCIVTGVDGAPHDVPLDTTTPVAWFGFANEGIADLVQPALARLLPRHFPRSFT